MGKIDGMRLAALLFMSLLAALGVGCRDDRQQLRLATTTSVENSGLLTAILPSFGEQTGIDVQVLAVGSGRALELLRRGDADVALTHDPVAEAAFLTETGPAAYRKIMFNDFLVVGPPQDDAGVRQAATAADAMRRIVDSMATFVSRGDESGTHARERQLWQKAGAVPAAARLLETGQGMTATLRIASERRGYTLTDRATFTQVADTVALQPLFEGDPDLLNTYAVIVARAAPRERDAARFVAWISDGDGRNQIASFTIAGTRPFLVWPANHPRDTPGDSPR